MNTEIESRYLVPDRILFNKLLRTERLDRYDLHPQGSVRIDDFYLDTNGRAVTRQGWACRLREEDGRWMVTVKGPKLQNGAVMSRPEIELQLRERILDAMLWPPGPVRDRVLELTSGLPLQHLVEIKQTRHRFVVLDSSRRVGDLTLDVVSFVRNEVAHVRYMLECELLPGGEMADLERIDRVLTRDYFLVAEPRSKLQQAMILIEQGGSLGDTVALTAQPMSLETICARYDVDLRRARYVAGLAERLFDCLGPLHGLTAKSRMLLRVAAMLHNIGDAGNHARRHIVGRDILFRQPVNGLEEGEQYVVAAAAYLHRKRITPERVAEVIDSDLPADQRRLAMQIAAIVRLASALSDRGPRSTRIDQVESTGSTVTLYVSGPDAHKDLRLLRKRSDLWQMVMGPTLQWQVLGPMEQLGIEVRAGRRIGVLDCDTMRQAASKILAFHFDRMLRREEGTRLGEDPEELHDMRVATRRLRSALGMFRGFVGGPLAQEAGDHLRELGRVLGEVRDLDVAIEKARARAEAADGLMAEDVEPLLASWSQRRRRPRLRLLHHLQSAGYARLQVVFRELLESLATPEPADAASPTVGDVAPRFMYVHWHVVMAYDAIIKGAPIELLHALRIDCKGLRYAMEAFVDILPADVAAVVTDVIALQDHLGELHDAAVAIHMIDEFLASPDDSGGIGAGSDRRGVLEYRRLCQEDLAECARTFPKAWKAYVGSMVGRHAARWLRGKDR